jgi:hypothetical protein
MLKYRCFSLDVWNDDFADRLAIFEDDAEEEDDVPESLSAGNGFSSSSKENGIIRKSFPESWIFDGNLELGYKYCFIF